MFKITAADREWIGKVLVPYFGIRKLSVARSASRKKWPDLWVTTGGIPQITVTAEWARQGADERRKRLVHEALHLALGLKDNHRYAGKYFSTFPAEDELSKWVYETRVKPLGSWSPKTVKSWQVVPGRTRVSSVPTSQQKVYISNPSGDWHGAKAAEISEAMKPMLVESPEAPVPFRYRDDPPEFFAQYDVAEKDAHQVAYLAGKYMPHWVWSWPMLKAGHDHPLALRSYARAYSETVADTGRRSPTFYTLHLEDPRGGKARTILVNHPKSMANVQGLWRMFHRGAVDANIESLKEMGYTPRQIFDIVNQHRPNPRSLRMHKPRNLFEENLIEWTKKVNWNQVVRDLRTKQARLRTIPGKHYVARIYLGNQMELGPLSDYVEPLYTYGVGQANKGHSVAMWLEALYVIAGLHNLTAFRAYADPADIYVEPVMTWPEHVSPDRVTEFADDLAALVGEDYVRRIEPY